MARSSRNIDEFESVAEARGEGLSVKVRTTTRTDTWTVPASDEGRDEFFHSKEWDELHIIHQETRVLLAVYSRAQVFAAVGRCRKRKKSRSGTVVNVLEVRQ